MVWKQRYLMPTIFACLAHIVLAVFALVSWQFSKEEAKSFKPPEHVVVNLVQIDKPKPVVNKPKPKPKVKPKPKPKPVVEKPKPKPVVKPKVETPKVETPKVETPKPKVEPVKETPKPEPEYETDLSVLDDLSFDLDAEIDAIDSDLQQLSEDESTIQDYVVLITSQVSTKWSKQQSQRPLNALVELKLLPTGELASVEITESSGNTVYDQSLKNAINAVYRFQVPKESRLFEQNFRNLTLRFGVAN